MFPTQRPTAASPKPWWVAFVAGMASYIDAAAITASGVALVIYQDVYGLTAANVGVLSALLTSFIGVGAIVGGRVGDRWGRKRVFVATMVMIAVGAALLVFGRDFTLLVVGSCLIGFGTGADLPVSLATVAEAAAQDNRGKLLGFSQILWKLGVLGSLGLSALVGDHGLIGGQILYGHIGVVALVVLVLRLGIPESADWRRAALARSAHREDPSTQPKASLRELLRPPYAHSFAALLIFYMFTNLAANTNGQFGTYLMVNVAGMPVSTQATITLIGNPIGIALGFLFMRTVDGPNRMKWFYFGATMGVVAMAIPAVFGVTFVTLLIKSLLVYFFYGFAFEAIMKVWAQESFPTLLRSTGQGTIIAAGRFGAAALAGVTPWIVEQGPRYLFVFLTVAILLGVTAAALVFGRRGHHTEFDEPAPEPAPAPAATSAD
ncbi:inositol transporter-like SP family MFS transporter [Rhodococcus wratislaviensis]|uniref:Major facilitator superfamily sugar transporter n=1 Tax=Rhodococcus wratislaviensis TaxID=44752 RepID=A0AB38FD87_RHOWR|nr:MULTISPECIES: MFS transporter [Rhodococcus]REE75689.1 inositol transporter-like SP family MFS transporter [Rhodococcus wratislaviensis]SPZ39272.1 major facilitator superfamily sugar transporter [Rhodococcus wratislaviensis]